jgi:hypothetical protein
MTLAPVIIGIECLSTANWPNRGTKPLERLCSFVPVMFDVQSLTAHSEKRYIRDRLVARIKDRIHYSRIANVKRGFIADQSRCRGSHNDAFNTALKQQGNTTFKTHRRSPC